MTNKVSQYNFVRATRSPRRVRLNHVKTLSQAKDIIENFICYNIYNVMEQQRLEQPIPAKEILAKCPGAPTDSTLSEDQTTGLATKIIEGEIKDRSRIAAIRESLGLAKQRLKSGIRSLIESGEPRCDIKFYPDRMYRCIGPKGYDDFIQSGVIQSRNRNLYRDVSFNLGKPSAIYSKGASGEYILEAIPDSAEFEHKTHPWNGEPMTEIDYRGCKNGVITKDSKIRIFKRGDDGKHTVVFDNIKDQALVEEEQ